jgi:hypothetical protein
LLLPLLLLLLLLNQLTVLLLSPLLGAEPKMRTPGCQGRSYQFSVGAVVAVAAA